MDQEMKQVLSMFKYDGEPYSCGAYGNGHINSTYKVECKIGDKTTRYILQRINNNIFPDTAALMDNIENITAFLKEKITKRGGEVLRETLNLVPTVTGKNFYTDENGGNWRSYIFIEDTVCYEKIEKPEIFITAGMPSANSKICLPIFPPKSFTR